MNKRQIIRKRLYHWTSSEGARQILNDGFRNGEDGLVWLSEHPTHAIGDRSRGSLLKVIFNIEMKELSSYANTLEEEYYDREAGEFLPTPPDKREYDGIVFYAMPADRLNAIGRTVLMPPKARARLMR